MSDEVEGGDQHPMADRTRDQYETVYQIYHEAEYGFGGSTSIWVAVENETGDRIEGRECGPTHEWPGETIVVKKENVAGWQEDQLRYRRIPEEVPTPSAEELRERYVAGKIDEEELENKLEEVEL